MFFSSSFSTASDRLFAFECRSSVARILLNRRRRFSLITMSRLVRSYKIHYLPGRDTGHAYAPPAARQGAVDLFVSVTGRTREIVFFRQNNRGIGVMAGNDLAAGRAIDRHDRYIERGGEMHKD